MRSSDGEELSQPYLELVDAYTKRFMPQNRQVAVLKCSPKENEKLFELRLKSIPKAWKLEAIAHKTRLKGCTLKIEILT